MSRPRTTRTTRDKEWPNRVGDLAARICPSASPEIGFGPCSTHLIAAAEALAAVEDGLAAGIDPTELAEATARFHESFDR